MSAVLLEKGDAPIAAYNEFRGQLAKLKADNAAAVFDYESPKGNKEARSHVYKLRQTKAAVEKVRKDEKAVALEYGRRVDSEAKEIIGEIEGMIEIHEKPLREIEEREAARVQGIRDRIEELRIASSVDAPLEAMRDRLAEIKAVAIDDSFGEFATEAAKVKDAAISAIESTIAAIEQREAEQAELVRLRREAEERARLDREEQLKREAAERATREAEAKAKAERDRAEQAARMEREAAERRELELKLAAEKAERARVEAEQKAANAAKEAEERLRRDAELKAKAEADAQAKREANKKHIAKINNEALSGFVAGGFSEADAKKIITMIAKGEIQHISIKY